MNLTANPRLDWKLFETQVVAGLKHFALIDPHFTGQLTLHFNDGGLCEIDKLERALRKKIKT